MNCKRPGLGGTYLVIPAPPSRPIPGYPNALRPQDVVHLRNVCPKPSALRPQNRQQLQGVLGAWDKGGPRFRDYSFNSGPNAGYTYRQFADGDIWIVRSPKSKLSAIYKVSRTANPKAWQAITDLIDATKKGRRQAAIAAAAPVARAVALEILRPPPKKQKRGGVEEEVPVDVPEEPAPSSFPWVPVAGAATLLLVIAAMAGGKGG